MKINLFAILILFLFTQCISINQIQMKENYLKLDKHNLTLVNGTYFFKDSSEFEFWKAIICKERASLKIKYANRISLNFIDESKLKIKLIANDSILKEKIIHGTLSDGVFTFSRLKAKGVYPLIWGLVGTKYQICATKKGFYIADDTVGQLFILILPTIAAKGWGAEDKEYEKIN